MSYVKGRRLEYRVRDYYIKLGCFVARSAGSRFPDLIVVFPDGKLAFVECKVNKGDFSKREKEDLKELAKRYRAKAYLAYRKGRKLVLEEMKGD